MRALAKHIFCATTLSSLTGCGIFGWTRYEVCDAQYNDCNTVAYFDDFLSCDRYRRFAMAYCNSVSTPGKIICDTTQAPSTFSAARCLN